MATNPTEAPGSIPAPSRSRRWLLAAGVVLLAAAAGLGSYWFTVQRVETSRASGADHAEAADETSAPDAAPLRQEEPPPPSVDPELEAGSVEGSDPAEPEPTEPAIPEGTEASLVTVTLDGQCTLELEEQELEQSDLIRPWNYLECRWAPVVLAPRIERWIAVRASLNGDDFDADDALARARSLGVPGQVLWSSHYPSLNPSLWVVFEGPFASESDAAAAARTASGGAYPRVLSDDPGDRYCLAPDGCVGERSR